VIRFGTLAPENGRQVSFVRLPDASWPWQLTDEGTSLFLRVRRAVTSTKRYIVHTSGSHTSKSQQRKWINKLLEASGSLR
jgi:hypothetical protein